jgi:hypothetical protein
MKLVRFIDQQSAIARFQVFRLILRFQVFWLLRQIAWYSFPSFTTPWVFEMITMGSFETSGINYPDTQRMKREGLSPQLLLILKTALTSSEIKLDIKYRQLQHCSPVGELHFFPQTLLDDL